MKHYSSLLLLLAACAGSAAAQIFPTAILQQPYSYPPISLVSGQFLRLNLANAGDAGSACAANLSFVNSDGNAVKNEDVKVDSAKSVFYVMEFTDVPAIAATATAQIRAVVKLQRQAGGVILTPGLTPNCAAVTSLELVDTASGQTRILLTNPTYISAFLPILASTPPSLQ